VIGAEPVSLADMKNFLKVPAGVTTDDALIKSLIKAARIQAEIIAESALVRSTFVQYMDHFPYWRVRERGYYVGQVGHASEHHHMHHGEIKIKQPPLISVESLVYIGTDGLPHTLNPGTDFIVDGAKKPGRIRPIPYTVWPLSLRVPNAIAISFTAGYAPDGEGVAAGEAAIAEPETSTPALNMGWQPTITIPQYGFFVDESGNVWIETASPSGVTGTSRPDFEAQAIGGTIATDGSAAWLNVGSLRGFWTPATEYSGQNAWVVLDTNSNLQLLIVASLVSQTSPPAGIQGSQTPAWASSTGLITPDNGIDAWRCLGNYRALGNSGASTPNSPEQQAAYTIDWTLPETVPIAVMQLVSHWYFNREVVAPGSVSEIPLHVMSLLATVSVPDYAPTPD
jgi:hypothetical protein